MNSQGSISKLTLNHFFGIVRACLRSGGQDLRAGHNSRIREHNFEGKSKNVA